MPAFYSTYAAQLQPIFEATSPHLMPAPAVAAHHAGLAGNTPGGQVVAAAPANFDLLYNTFINTFGPAQFAWDPSARGSFTFGKLMDTLDGTRVSGECKLLAGALYALWIFPAPFGLGQGAARPAPAMHTFNNYDGNNGFISHHPLAGVRGLLPNVVHPFGNPHDPSTYQPLYQWGDHKVVYYNGRAYDPTYMHIWNNESEMVAFEFTLAPHPDPNVYPLQVVTPNVAKGWLIGQTMYMRYDTTVFCWKGPYRDIA